MPAMNMQAVGIAAALGSAASWALGAILFKRIGESMSPLAMTLAKAAVSVIFLGIALIFLGFTAITPRNLALLVASGIVGIAIGDTLFFAALQHLGPQTLVVLMMVGQVLTALLALVYLGERPSSRAWGGIACVIVGVTIVLWANLSGDRQRSRVRGIVLGLLSVVCMSVSVIMAKQGFGDSSVVQETMQETMQGTCVRMLAGALGIALYGLLTGRLCAWAAEGRDARLAGPFLFAVCVVTFGGFWLSLLAIRNVDIAIANTLNSLEPVFVLPLAAIFLKEKITPPQIIGTLTALVGVVVLCKS
jgi:drug/metabolite transporter (DMT)-like permease